MSLQMARLFKNVLYGLGIAAAIAAWLLQRTGRGGSMLLWIAAFALLIAGFVVTVVFYRCPNCKHNFPVREALPEVCPHCGQKLD